MKVVSISMIFFKKVYRRKLFELRMLRQQRPKLLIMDFDGCLTDDHLYLNAEGEEFVRLSRKDGLGSSRLKEIGIELMILSSETNLVVASRANKLGIDFNQGVYNKLHFVIKLIEDLDISKNDIWYLGNDINDLQIMNFIPFSLCPLDASPEIRRISKFVLPVKGGEGVLNFIARALENKF